MQKSSDKMTRRLFALLIYPIAILLLIEDWLWDVTARALRWLSALPLINALEKQISRLPPYAALTAFILPALMLLPLKIFALLALAHGHTILGISIIFAAKVSSAALSARLYQLTRPSLMTLAWFARWSNAFIAFKNRLIAKLHATAAWRKLHYLRLMTRRQWRRLHQALRQRFSGGKLLRLIRKFSAQYRARDRS